MSETKGPQFIGYLVPILDVLKELGGSGAAGEVCDRVFEKLGIPEEAQAELLPSGVPRIRNQMQWARLYLVRGGLLDATQKGIWALTKAGFAGLAPTEALPFYLKASKDFRKSAKVDTSGKKPSKAAAAEETGIPESGSADPGVSLLAVLQSLPPEGFERICQRLLREAGFQQVTVTGKSGDGGIDGFGILEVNPLVSFNVLFQCKRYLGAVSSPQIRDFRGAMQGRADKGIVLTTGTFTQDAKKEARRDGAPPIELVDGEKLVSMFERFRLGVSPRTVYEVDRDIFDEYR